MPTRGATATHHAASRRTASGPDAITLLKEDHRKVSGLFKEFEKASEARKPGIAEQICEELTIHATIEEEIFYPEARQCLDNEKGEDLLDEAEVEHDGIKGLVNKIEAAGGNGELFEAQVTVLKEYVEHHVKEEETELFPKLRKAKFDAKDVGARLAERKKELMGK